MKKEFAQPNIEIKTISEKEKKHRASRILLVNRRHGEKPTPEMEEPEVEITKRSKKEIVSRANEFGPKGRKDIKQAIAFGAGNVRTEITAGLMMGGIDDEITGEETLGELKEKLGETKNKQGKTIATKLSSKKHLAFAFSDSEIDQKLRKASSKGEWIKFITEKSDQMAQELQDKKSITYTRVSAQLAELYLKYVERVAKRWDQLVNDKDKQYNYTLERYFSTPAAITAFLAKIIEKTKGIEERNKFATSLKKGHFDYLEGYDIEILIPEDGDPKNPQIRITYHGDRYNFDETISKELLQKIVKEGVEFEKKIDKKNR